MIIEKIESSLLNAVRCCNLDEKNVIVYVNNIRNFRQLSQFSVVREYPFINAVGISCYPYEIEKLSLLPYVEYITAGSKVFMLRENIVENVNELKYVRRLTGKGVTLCIMDTGIQPHLDLCVPSNRIMQFIDIETNNENPFDDNGHGTFVAGISAGNGIVSGRKIMGVAPEANLVGVKVIASNGESGAFTVLDGMQWVLNNRRKLDIKVVCMSFGSTPLEKNDPLKQGAEVLVKNGITVICASGNSGENSLKSPAISPDVISVGAINEKDNKVADFTSRGIVYGRHKPEIYASGVNVVSLASNGTYAKMSGTSVSAPYIAGASCLLYQRYPSIVPHKVKEILLRSSKVINGNFILRLE